MLDPGRYLAEAIYFLQYTLAQLLWALNRALLSIAVIAESVNTWVTENVGYFVQLLVNALSAPLGGMFILALTALGFWYLLNNIVPTQRWVDPGKLFSYGLIAFFFFSSPIVVIEMMEDLRQSLNAGIDQALIDGAAGDIFAAGMDGTDPGLPGALADVNGDGVIGSFDLVAGFMLVANLDELDSSEFPLDFEADFFPFGDPSSINLSDEADQQLAKALASDGIERLFFAGVAIPTAIAEHFLRLALTGVAMFLYAGAPFAMIFAFFIYTQAFLGAYLRQFINLLIETFMSVVITAIMLGLLAAAALQGVGLYIGASLIALGVLLWRIKSALRLAGTAIDLFGGAMLTGGAGGMTPVRMGRQALSGAAAVTGAALTGGLTLAAGSAVMATAAAVQADGRSEGGYLGLDPEKADGRVRQLKTIAGYTIGRSEATRRLIENTHEARTLVRNLSDGEAQPYAPDTLDYLRAGSSMSNLGSSPWMAMRLSPSLRAAYDDIGGRRNQADTADLVYEEDGAPILATGGRHDDRRDGRPPTADWRADPATPAQLALLRRLGADVEDGLTRGQASAQIDRARRRLSQEDAPGDGAGAAPRLPQLDARFASLEQALAALTAALLNGEGAPDAQSRAETPESVNGPLPDWLQPPGAQNGPVVPVASRPHRDGWEEEAETTLGEIRLQPVQASRRRLINDLLARLADADAPTAQTAQQTLVTYTGTRNAAQVQTAVRQHGQAAVQQAATATADLFVQYRQQERDGAAILTAFQSGEAAAAVRETTETPLAAAQLAAVADMVLLPQRQLTRPQLAAVIGRQAAAGAESEQAVIEALEMPVDFGPQTGAVRGVLDGARQLTLSPADLARLAALIQDGLREQAQAQLHARGAAPQQAHALLNEMAALPEIITVPQTTAVPPSQPMTDAGEANEQ